MIMMLLTLNDGMKCRFYKIHAKPETQRGEVLYLIMLSEFKLPDVKLDDSVTPYSLGTMQMTVHGGWGWFDTSPGERHQLMTYLQEQEKAGVYEFGEFLWLVAEIPRKEEETEG